MKNQVALLFAVALVVVAGAIFATAQSGPTSARQQRGEGAQPPPPPPPPFGLPRLDRLARDLNLTDAQQAELKTFFDAERATIDAMVKKLDAERRQLDEATRGGQFDETQVRALAAQQAQTFAELIVEHKRAEARLYNTLTPEQRTKFEQLRERRPPPPPPPPPDDEPDDR